MPIVRHADPDAFLAASLPAAARDAAVAAIFRAFAAGVKRRPPAPDERLYLATWHGEDRSAAAVQRGDYALFVDTPEPDLAARFADDLAGEHPSLQGVTGALAICEAFARRWRELTSRTAAMRAHLRHHVLTELASVSSAPGTMRVAADADLDWLIEASIAFAAEAGLADSPAQVRRNVPPDKRAGPLPDLGAQRPGSVRRMVGRGRWRSTRRPRVHAAAAAQARLRDGARGGAVA